MAERYRPLFKLDSGGMAEVYVAEAESMAGFKKKVAIKRILPGLIKDERFVRMFLDEARLSLHLNHANIVSVFDIGKSDATYFIVMEYVEGTNLKQLMEFVSGADMRGMPIPLALWILNEALKGLDYAHRLRDHDGGKPIGIVHRDISPPNILISWNGEVKLVDFGLAKAATQLESTDPGIVKGKFAYLAPEAAHGLEVDHRADIFAVGILAFEMLTGRRLFLGETDYQTVELVRKATVPDMRAINPDIPEELVGIIQRSLAREPSNRYQHASEFADELLAFLFSRSLKVGSRDISQLLADMRRKTPGPEADPVKQSNLIMNLIDDELLHFRSLDAESGDAPVTGSQPLETLAGGGGSNYDPSAPLAIEDFDQGDKTSADAEADPEEEEVTKQGRKVRKSRTPTSRLPSPAPKRESSIMPWVVLLGVIVAGGGAYYWLIVLGNLDKLTAG